MDLSTHQSRLEVVVEESEGGSDGCDDQSVLDLQDDELILDAPGHIDSESDEETHALMREICAARKELAASDRKAKLRAELNAVNKELDRVRVRRQERAARPANSNSLSQRSALFSQASRLDEARQSQKSSVAGPREPLVQFLPDLDSQFDPSATESSESDSGSGKSSKNKSKNKEKSGMFPKATDVSQRQVWPHLALSDEYPGKRLTFKALNFPLFVAGELEIITCASTRISNTERNSRMCLLKTICYVHKYADWDIVRDIYASILNKIEQGLLSWDNSDFSKKLIGWLVKEIWSGL